jgi:SAM-dependent methyltransferase
MEVTDEHITWLNPAHPNYGRWLRGRELAEERASVVSKIISDYKICKNLNILDLGSGEGGTSLFFSKKNNVISYDLNKFRLKRQQQSGVSCVKVNGNGEFLPFYDSSFDLIILQDVIEHTTNRLSLAAELKRVLVRGGIIYLSTPNKFSLFNIISDPHWGIPFLSLFNRNAIRKIFLKFFRKEDFNRNDIAELLSLDDLRKLFSDFSLQLNTKKTTKLLKKDSQGILWSNFHLLLYNILKKTKFISILNKIANNKPGLVNNFLTPTFYITLTKK